MFEKYCLLLMVSAMALAIAGCHDTKLTATDVQLARMDEVRADYHHQQSAMVDNAILHDMSIADIHFVPHSGELSGTGVARLDRMALLLDTYGGTVRYETAIVDEALIQTRLDHVREYLTLTGCSMERVNIETGLSSGRGMPARDALEAEQKAQEAGQSGGGSTGDVTSLLGGQG